jgi:uncharacterized protein YneF (UPF0154 family)
MYVSENLLNTAVFVSLVLMAVTFMGGMAFGIIVFINAFDKRVKKNKKAAKKLAQKG